MIDTIWELPEEGLEPNHVFHVVRKVLAEIDGAAIEPVGPNGHPGLTFHIGLPEWLVREAGDRPQRAPDERDRYWCVLRVDPGGDGRPAALALAMAEADTARIPHGASEVVERIAGLLGGRPAQ